MSTPGERIRALRVAQGLSQRQVAEACQSVTHAYMSRIEGGDRNPSRRALAEIAAKLNTTALYLESGAGPHLCPHCHSTVDVTMLVGA